MHGGGWALYIPPAVVLCPLLKISLGHPYLKILDFSQLLIADTPMNFFCQKILFTPSDSTFGTPSTKIFFNFLPFTQKIFKQAIPENL